MIVVRTGDWLGRGVRDRGEGVGWGEGWGEDGGGTGRGVGRGGGPLSRHPPRDA